MEAGSAAGSGETSAEDDDLLRGVKLVPFSNENYYWEAYEYQLVHDCVPNEKAAVQIASIIVEQRQREGALEGFKASSVSFQKDHGIWIVTFSDFEETEDGGIIAGSDFCIAISKRSAEVVAMWPEGG